MIALPLLAIGLVVAIVAIAILGLTGVLGPSGRRVGRSASLVRGNVVFSGSSHYRLHHGTVMQHPSVQTVAGNVPVSLRVTTVYCAIAGAQERWQRPWD